MTTREKLDILRGLKVEDSYFAGLGESVAHAKAFASVGSCFAGAAPARLAPRGRLGTPPQAMGVEPAEASSIAWSA
jgi:hypothetical protein